MSDARRVSDTQVVQQFHIGLSDSCLYSSLQVSEDVYPYGHAVTYKV